MILSECQPPFFEKTLTLMKVQHIDQICDKPATMLPDPGSAINKFLEELSHPRKIETILNCEMTGVKIDQDRLIVYSQGTH